MVGLSVVIDTPQIKDPRASFNESNDYSLNPNSPTRSIVRLNFQVQSDSEVQLDIRRSIDTNAASM